MKNKSFINPFPRLGDSFFDMNHDGKLGFFETAFRDAHIKEMSNKAKNKSNSKPCNKPTQNKKNLTSSQMDSMLREMTGKSRAESKAILKKYGLK